MLRVNSAGQATRDSTNTLDDALAALEFQTSSRTVDGGGVAISVGPAIQAFTDNEVIVSFCGHLTNVDYLAWRLFSPEGRRGDSIAQNPLEAASKLIGGRCYEAELICHMYKTFGTKSLPKLRGKFSFSCFDARSVRVFAARDPSGTYPLLYGRDGMGTVVVANFESAKEMLDGGKFQPVPAGCFIYGHRGISPQRYAKDMASSQLQQQRLPMRLPTRFVDSKCMEESLLTAAKGGSRLNRTPQGETPGFSGGSLEKTLGQHQPSTRTQNPGRWTYSLKGRRFPEAIILPLMKGKKNRISLQRMAPSSTGWRHALSSTLSTRAGMSSSLARQKSIVKQKQSR